MDHSHQRRLKRRLRIFRHQRRQKPRELTSRQNSTLSRGIDYMGGNRKRYVATHTRPNNPRFRSSAGIGRFANTRFPWLLRFSLNRSIEGFHTTPPRNARPPTLFLNLNLNLNCHGVPRRACGLGPHNSSSARETPSLPHSASHRPPKNDGYFDLSKSCRFPLFLRTIIHMDCFPPKPSHIQMPRSSPFYRHFEPTPENS